MVFKTPWGKLALFDYKVECTKKAVLKSSINILNNFTNGQSTKRATVTQNKWKQCLVTWSVNRSRSS